MFPREIVKYEESGLLLIPCRQDKRPAFKGWQQIASSERAKHEEWFENNGYAVGLLTGERNRLVYVDCDQRNEAERFFREFRSRIHSIIITPHGVHFPFKHPGEKIANAVRSRIGNALADIRGDGGFVIAPPSLIDGKAYRFVEGYELDVSKLEIFDPQWVKSKTPSLSPAFSPRGNIKNPIKYISRIIAVSGSGGHNATFRAACVLKNNGIPETEALAIMVEWNMTNAQPPWTTRELLHKVRSAYESNTDSKLQYGDVETLACQ